MGVKKKLRINSSQISFGERDFHESTRRGNSYQSSLELLERLKKSFKRRYNHLIFEDPKHIFTIEKALLAILEELE